MMGSGFRVAVVDWHHAPTTLVPPQRGFASDRRGMWRLSRERGHLARNRPKARDCSSGRDARAREVATTWLNCEGERASRSPGSSGANVAVPCEPVLTPPIREEATVGLLSDWRQSKALPIIGG